jgi:hypothetical protein
MLAAPCLVFAFLALNVKDFGAQGDGRSIDTAALQKAIDTAAERGGETVVLPPGRYLSGTLHLRNKSRLFLEAGATLAMSPDDGHFAAYEPPPALLSKRVTRYTFSTRGLARAANLPPTEDDSETTYMRHALLLGEDVSDVFLEGPGRLDGNRTKRGGPKPISFKNSRNILIRDLTIENAPNYAISLLAADFVTIDNIKILNAFADGIDPDNSHYVRITNCYIDAADDAICPKASLALGRRRSTEHLLVSNCTLRTNASAFKFGTESAGSFRDVTVSNLTILQRDSGRPPNSGIALESVDGATIERILVQNVSMKNVRVPIFLRLGNRGRGMDEPAPGQLRDVILSNISATGATFPSHLTAVPGAQIENVTLRDIQVEAQLPAAMPSTAVAELESQYPEGTMFGDLPAAALYVKRAAGLVIQNFRFRPASPLFRPVFTFDSVTGLTFNQDYLPSLLWHVRN